MKKIIFILLLFLLAGCTPTGKKLDEKSTVILNITSEVDPLIVSSHGEGNYNAETKTYTLNIPSTNSVDISLSHPEYETVCITITQTELLEGTVTRSIDFGKVPTATLVFKLYSIVDLEMVTITDYEFTRENSLFTVKLPSRNINKTITISAENYQPIELEITPEKLVVGYYYDEFFLIGKNKVLLTFLLPSGFFGIDLYNSVTNEIYSPYSTNKKLTYIVDKDSVVFFDNPITNQYTHINITENETINFDILPESQKNNYIISNVDHKILNDTYYEYNGKREKSIFSESDDVSYYTNIPIGSQILFNDNGILYYMDHIPSEKHIFFSLDDFGEAILPESKFSLYDIVSKTYITEFIDFETQHQAINNVFTTNITRLRLGGYYVTQEDLLIQEKNENNEWFSYIEVAPSPDNLILEFTDSNGDTIENPNVTFQQIYFNGVFLKATGEIRVGSRYIPFDYGEYVMNLEYEKINKDNYYKSSKKVVIDTDAYWISVYSKYNNFFLTVNGREREYYLNNNVRIYYFKINEIIQIQTKYSNVEYVYPLTRDLLEKGILIIDDVGHKLPDQFIEITLQNPVDSEFSRISFYNGFEPINEALYHVLYNDNKTKAMVYFVFPPEKIEVVYISNNEFCFENYSYNNSGQIIVENP
jgi:hypothetical protein